MPRPAPLPHPLSLGPFHYAEAARAGIKRSRLSADDIAHPHRGLYVPAAGEADLVGRCENLVALLGEHQWFSHLTAARLWGFPLPFSGGVAEPLHVTALSDSVPMRRANIIGWETEVVDAPRTMLGLIPVLEPAAVWCQLAVPGSTGIDSKSGRKRSLSHQWLVAVGDYLLTGPKRGGQRHPLCSRDDLAKALRRHRGKRGAKALAGAIEWVRAGAHSPQETRLRLGLVDQGLTEPDVQVPIMTAAGLRHGDLGYPKARLLLEYQGDHHRTDRAQWLEDLTRVQLLEDAGYRVMLVGAADLEPDCSALAERVRRALAGRAFVGR